MMWLRNTFVMIDSDGLAPQGSFHCCTSG